jgi:hypothetical protein
MTSPYDPSQPIVPQEALSDVAATPGYEPWGPGYPPQGYPPPGYPAPGYAPPGYPPHPGPDYPAPGYPIYVIARPTSTLAILSLVFAFVFPVAGIVLGHVARKQIRERGENGDGLAVAGLWCSYIFAAASVLICGLYVAILVLAFHDPGVS